MKTNQLSKKVDFKVKANKSRRTFTIWKDGSKYRTLPMSKVEFEECEMNSNGDWIDFLNSSDSYYLVK